MNTNPIYVWLTLASIAAAHAASAAEPSPSGAPPAAPPRPNYTLVFSDDFSADPNSNGKWTVFRRQNDHSQEGFWNATEQDWYLTTANRNLACAAFANYELTATVWKVDFRYRVGGPNGADGFVFMFYKNKAAYGVPDSGAYMAFQTRNSNGSDNPVRGYGLQFDTYQDFGCDPLEQNYVAIVHDVICNSAYVFQPFAAIDDNVWHSVEFRYTNGRVVCTVDDKIFSGFYFTNPDYQYTGIGFGAGTGSEVSNQSIDDFQIWVDQG